MTGSHVDRVVAIADRLHPNNYERPEVFLNRLALFPDGCRVLMGEAGMVGYAFAHPARLFQPPPLDTVFDAFPSPAECLHLHDIAVLPEMRGRGATGRFLDWLRQVARRDGIAKLALVAVNGSVEYWCRHGFAPASDPALDKVLGSYGGGGTYMVAGV